MAFLASTAIDHTLGDLYSGTREQVNALANAPTAVSTDITFQFSYPLKGIKEGAVLGIDLELVYVIAIPTSGTNATVIRGYRGSTIAAHAIGTPVYVNPKFSRHRVFVALNHELASLSSPQKGLFAVKTVDLTYTGATQGYDLTGVTSVERLLEVRAQRTGGQKQWDTLGRTQIQLQREHDIGDFASGFSLQLLDGDPGRTVRVVYAAPFGQLTSEVTDANNTTVAFPETANDILPLGAAIRLAYPREVSRNFFETQGEPRRAEEVPANANLNAGAGLARLYESRVREEAGRLARKYPLRRYA